VRIVLDACVPAGLARFLSGHEVTTVSRLFGRSDLDDGPLRVGRCAACLTRTVPWTWPASLAITTLRPLAAVCALASLLPPAPLPAQSEPEPPIARVYREIAGASLHAYVFPPPATVLGTARLSLGGAQGILIAAGAEVFLDGGEGITGSCLEGSSKGGAVARASYELSPHAGVEATAHVHRWKGRPSCESLFPARDGTFLDRDRRNLLTNRFVAADVRARVRVGRVPAAPVLSLGAGLAFRSDADLPYGVVGIGVPVPLGPIRVVPQIDVYLVRVRFDLVERTWDDFMLVSAVPRGSEHVWKPTGAAALLIEVPITW
jgi:hypothetical protein